VTLFKTPPLAPFAKTLRPGPSASSVAAKPARPKSLLPEPPSVPRIVPIARLAQGGRWRVEAMRALSEPCFLWFTRGQGRITMGGVTRGYGPYSAAFLPAGVMHGFEISSQTTGLAVFFGKNSELTLPHAAQYLRVREPPVQAEISGLIESVTRELESNRPGSDRAALHYLVLLSVIIERQGMSQAAEPRASEAARKLVTRYAAVLERDFRSGLGVADYAAQLGVTATHLTRSCRISCGRAASELLQDRRLYEARRLLSETGTPVKDIAAALGFNSPAYFTRAFQARVGKTPSAFRKGG
jgi:AraC-like DNA-binding protein